MALKQRYGRLELVDARAEPDHPLCRRATELGLDLDEGMAIFAGERVYFGHEAIGFLSEFGAPERILTRASRVFGTSERLSRGTYACLRTVRNLLIRLRGAGRIDNLARTDQPIFKSVFGADWERLPPVFRRHYANRPYADDRIVVEGIMEVRAAAPLRLLGPLLRQMGFFPAVTESTVPVTVAYESDPASADFVLHRTFRFADGGPYTFRTRMRRVRGGDIVEIMPFGLYWRCRYSWEGDRVMLAHRGFGLALLGGYLPLPLGLLLGANEAEERAVDDRCFDMVTRIKHPLWGGVYEYRGRFGFRGDS